MLTYPLQDIHAGLKPSSPGCVGEGLGCSDVGVHREKSKVSAEGKGFATCPDFYK